MHSKRKIAEKLARYLPARKILAVTGAPHRRSTIRVKHIFRSLQSAYIDYMLLREFQPVPLDVKSKLPGIQITRPFKGFLEKYSF